MKIFVCEKFIPENYKGYFLVTPREVEFNDKEAWISLMRKHLSNPKALIVYPEAYLDIVALKHLLIDFCSSATVECSFFTHSPYFISDDQFMLEDTVFLKPEDVVDCDNIE
jgi:hypothetical protein